MRCLVACAVLFSSAAVSAGPKFSRAQIKYFETNVRPLLIAKCTKCHGEKKQSQNLRLDSRNAIVKGGDTGPAIVPGKPKESLLIEAIKWESYKMPPKNKLAAKEIAILERWIKMGAPWPNEAAPKTTVSRPKITAEDRKWWAFQPIRDPAVPRVDDPWVRNAIDRFVLQRMHSQKFSPNPRADRRVLIRRVTFDLTGLPPTPAEVAAFVQDKRSDAWQRLIARLLKSPRYGERWGRHWLDLVRYADTDGFRADSVRKNAWRYRDYIIDSFNKDKPYDRLIKEQIAGDELFPGDRDALIATGYLRHGVYEFNQRDARKQWSDILNEVTDVTGDVFLAMGMGCAKCHDHKFDPILQKDYFRLRAFFAAMEMRDETPIPTAAEKSAHDEKLAKWEAATRAIRDRLATIEAPAKKKAANDAISRFPDDVEVMARKPRGARKPLELQLSDLVHRQVVYEYTADRLKKWIAKKDKAEWEKLRKQLAGFDKLKPKPLPTARTAGDVSRIAPPTFIEGKERLGEVPPGILSVMNEKDALIPRIPSDITSTGRRAALANWIASPKNPLTARVMVNRIWQQHFGTGLVSTPSDFGRLGAKPSHPELLDWLASRFIQSGWSIKAVHRLILNSATYQQSAAANQNPMGLSRHRIRRLDADQIRDAALSVSGELEIKAGGPAVSASSSPRRTIFTTLRRNKPDELLSAFDFSVGTESVPARNTTITPGQSLLMINGEWMLSRARALANRLRKFAGNDAGKQIRLAHQLLYSRAPTDKELRLGRAFLAEPSTPVAIPFRLKTAPQLQRFLLERTPRDELISVPGSKALAVDQFRIEATIYLRSLYPDATVRTIVSAWDSNTRNAGWSLGVTSTKSAFKPRNLILQFVGKDSAGKIKYEVVASNLRVELNRPYRVTVDVSLKDRKKSGVTFTLEDLSRKKKLTATVEHKVVSIPKTPALVVGGRINSTRHRWEGLLGEVKFVSARKVFGYWKFSNPRFPLGDSSGNKRHLRMAQSKDDALVDYCHVLLNTNEFLFVE